MFASNRWTAARNRQPLERLDELSARAGREERRMSMPRLIWAAAVGVAGRGRCANAV